MQRRPRPGGVAQLVDRLARYVITGGGILIIVSVIGIIAFILMEAFPLLQGARVEPPEVLDTVGAGEAPLAAGTDEYRDLLYEVFPSGSIVFRKLPGGEVQSRFDLPGVGDARLTAVSVNTDGERIAWGDVEGRVGLTRIFFRTEYLEGGGRAITVRLADRGSVRLPASGAVVGIDGGRDEDGFLTLAALQEDGGLRVARFDPDEEEWAFDDLTAVLEGRPRAIDLSLSGARLAAGTDAGEVVLWDLIPGREPRYLERRGVTASADEAVTALTFLIGDQSLVVGGQEGSLSVWSRVPEPDSNTGDRTLKKIHPFPSLPAGVVAMAPSPRDKGFLTLDGEGTVRLQYSTSERTLAELKLTGEPRMVFMPARADGALALAGSGSVSVWEVDNPHPEISLRTLFGKVWYEGLPEPAFVWQSSGATDDFEPKLSLVPLLFGTFKGAIYAMLFSVPLAILGAIYTSQFASPRVRNTVKPFVEILAALPSVIIGFLAGLWLAPLMIRVFPGATLMIGLVPLTVMGGVFAWEAMPRNIRRRMHKGNELYLILILALAAAGVSLVLGPWVERLVFGGDFIQWLRESAGLVYDQRNCAVVGFALGFAVIPIIFTISEDAMSSVPRHLVSASLALGANRWTTALRVVLPTASAGIFAAIMLGFGRAVGETMIVLMATGNTPIMDWNIFNGMRTLSANIAVEIPEAPVDGTLYRVLFLSGALLFVLTFLTNSLAEIVGHRLRKKYQRL